MVSCTVDVGLERSDKEGGVVVELVKAWDEVEKVSVDEFLLWYPDLLTVFVDYRILVGMLVDDARAEQGCKEAGEVVVIDTYSFFGEGSKSRVRSRRMRRRNMMYRSEDNWQG